MGTPARTKKNDLFGSMRMMLPEHKQAFLNHREDSKLVPKPTIEEDGLMEFAYRIQDSIQYDYALAVSYWKATKGDMGVIVEEWGIVQRIDQQAKRIKLGRDDDYVWIDLRSIVKIMEK